MIVLAKKYAAVNAELDRHRVWHLEGVEGIPAMAAIEPKIAECDNPGDPDHGKLLFLFGDGGRWRHPIIDDARVVADGVVEVVLPTWWPTVRPDRVATLRPYTIQIAKGVELNGDVEGMDPNNPDHQAIFDGFFPR